MAKGKDKPFKQTKKPKSDKPKGAGSAYKQLDQGQKLARPTKMHLIQQRSAIANLGLESALGEPLGIAD
jgi:hypothetical protein